MCVCVNCNVITVALLLAEANKGDTGIVNKLIPDSNCFLFCVCVLIIMFGVSVVTVALILAIANEGVTGIVHTVMWLTCIRFNLYIFLCVC